MSIISHHRDASAAFRRNYRDTENKRRGLDEDAGRDKQNKVVKFFGLSDRTVRTAKNFTNLLIGLSIGLFLLRAYIIWRDETLGITGLIGTAGLVVSAWVFYGLDFFFGPLYEPRQIDEYLRRRGIAHELHNRVNVTKQLAQKKYTEGVNKLKEQYEHRALAAKRVVDYSLENLRNLRIRYQNLRGQYERAFNTQITNRFTALCRLINDRVRLQYNDAPETIQSREVKSILQNRVSHDPDCGSEDFDNGVEALVIPQNIDALLVKPVNDFQDIISEVERAEATRRLRHRTIVETAEGEE